MPKQHGFVIRLTARFCSGGNQPLFTDTVCPLCQQQVHGKYRNLADVLDNLLIHTDQGEQYASYPTWAGWFRAVGIARSLAIRTGLRVGDAAVVFALASRGARVSLIPKMLMQAPQ